MKIKRLTGIIIILLCSSGIQSAQALRIVLGQGHLSSTDAIYLSPYKNGGPSSYKNTSFNNPSGTLKFTQVETNEELSDLLSIGGSLSVSTPQFSGSLKGGYNKNFDTSARVMHIVYKLEVSYGAVLDLGNGDVQALLTPTAYTQFRKGAQAFSDRYGDEAITSATATILLLVDIAIKFDSTQSLEGFNADLEGKYNGGVVSGSITGKLDMVSKTAKKGTSITVSAVQFGGDPTQLSKLFGKPNANGGYGVTECGGTGEGAATACTDMINKVIGYGTTMSDQLQFPGTKIQNPESPAEIAGSMDYTKVFYITPEYTKYEDWLGQAGPEYNADAQTTINTMTEKNDAINSELRLLREYKANIGINNTRYTKMTGYDFLNTYQNGLETMVKAFDLTGTKKNPTLDSCIKTMNPIDCTKANEYIAKEEAKVVSSNRAYAAVKAEEAADQNGGGEAFPTPVKRIKTENYRIWLLTLMTKEDANNSAKFQKMICNLLPIGDTGAERQSRLDCPVTYAQKTAINSEKDVLVSAGLNTNGELVLSRDSDGTGDIIYSITYGGGQKYCFAYPTTRLQPTGAIGSAYVADPVLVKYARITESEACSSDLATYTPVQDKDMGSGTKPSILNVTEVDLINTYPNYLAD